LTGSSTNVIKKAFSSAVLLRSGSHAGGIVGDLRSSARVEDGESRAVLISGGVLGGILGHHERVALGGTAVPEISRSRSSSIILNGTSASDRRGGLVGQTYYRFSIADNYSAGLLMSGRSSQGGLVGARFSGGATTNGLSIATNYSSTLILTSGGNEIGGLLGYGLSISDTNLFSITDSFSIGRIISTSSSRGNLVGNSVVTGTTLAGIFSSHYLVQAGNPAACIGVDTNSNTNQQCNQLAVDYTNPATFTTPGSPIFASWDFTSTWKWPSNGGAPILKWELDDSE